VLNDLKRGSASGPLKAEHHGGGKFDVTARSTVHRLNCHGLTRMMVCLPRRLFPVSAPERSDNFMVSFDDLEHQQALEVQLRIVTANSTDHIGERSWPLAPSQEAKLVKRLLDSLSAGSSVKLHKQLIEEPVVEGRILGTVESDAVCFRAAVMTTKIEFLDNFLD
jgi:hypothetical protein